MKVSFYVLSESKAQDFLGFVCQLTQTALNKSSHSLVILVDERDSLESLDNALWSNEATSFIPHHCLPFNKDTQSALNTSADSDATINTDISADATPSDFSLAPVLIGDYLPADFCGIVINTTSHPVTDFIKSIHNVELTRILEIIKPDAVSVDQGRSKYKSYQQLGYELTHFKV